MKKPRSNHDEFHDNMLEYAEMHAWLNKSGKDASATWKKLLSMAKYAALCGALALALLASASLHVRSTLTSVSSTGATVHARVIVVRERDQSKPVRYRLTEGVSGALLQEASLPTADTHLLFEGLTPSTQYVIRYYTGTDSDPKSAGRFVFFTLADDNVVPGPDDTNDMGDDQAGADGGSDDNGRDDDQPEIIIIDDEEPILLAILTPALPNAKEETAYSASIATEYTGVDALTFSASGLPNGLAIDASSGTITGTPVAGAATGSPYSVSISVTDGTRSDSADYSLVVAPKNVEPLNILNKSLASTKRTYAYSDAVRVDRASTLGLTYKANGLPDGLVINATTGAITGRTERTVETGTHYVSVSVTDGVVTASKTLALYVGLPSKHDETATDLVIDYLEYEFSPPNGMFASALITTNDAQNVNVSMAYNASALAFTSSAGAGTLTLDTALLNLTPAETSTLTMTVNYTLDGAAMTKTATIRAEGSVLDDTTAFSSDSESFEFELVYLGVAPQIISVDAESEVTHADCHASYTYMDDSVRVTASCYASESVLVQIQYYAYTIILSHPIGPAISYESPATENLFFLSP